MKNHLSMRSAMIILILILVFCSILIPYSCTHLRTTDAQDAFTSYLDQLFADWVSADTLTLHYQLADPSEYGILRESVSLTNSYLKNTSTLRKNYPLFILIL